MNAVALAQSFAAGVVDGTEMRERAGLLWRELEPFRGATGPVEPGELEEWETLAGADLAGLPRAALVASVNHLTARLLFLLVEPATGGA